MKKLIAVTFMFILLTSLSPVFAIFGGEVIDYSIDRCNNMTVEITPCQDTEWLVYPNCSEYETGKWVCNCTDGFDLHLKPAVNAVGIYDIEISYTYLAPEPTRETISFEYKPSIGVIYKNITLNVTKTIERIIYINQTTNQTVFTEDITRIEELEKKIDEVSGELKEWKDNYLNLTFILVLLVSAIIVLIVFPRVGKKWGSKNGKQQNEQKKDV